MSNLDREPFIDASYQVLVHLVKRFQRRFIKIGQTETRIANPIDWLYAACLEYFIFFSIDSSEARKQYDEYLIVNLAKWKNVHLSEIY
jgi:hypothetical protein